MDWKAEFLSKPSVSIRKGIADNYGAPYEDTSTLVLTAPSGKFVDVRFPLRLITPNPTQESPLSSYPSFWAFSGVSATTFYDAQNDTRPGFPYTAHTVFTHDIDSKGPGIVDEGDCFLLPNGDVMEVGVWSNSKQLYKELWTEPPILPGRDGLVKSPVVVMETTQSMNGRGIVIRVGDYIQGIYQRKSVSTEMKEVLVVRVTRNVLTTSNSASKGTSWTVDPRSTQAELDLIPHKFLQERDILSLGETFDCQGDSWKVTEVL